MEFFVPRKQGSLLRCVTLHRLSDDAASFISINCLLKMKLHIETLGQRKKRRGYTTSIVAPKYFITTTMQRNATKQCRDVTYPLNYNGVNRPDKNTFCKKRYTLKNTVFYIINPFIIHICKYYIPT